MYTGAFTSLCFRRDNTVFVAYDSEAGVRNSAQICPMRQMRLQFWDQLAALSLWNDWHNNLKTWKGRMSCWAILPSQLSFQLNEWPQSAYTENKASLILLIRGVLLSKNSFDCPSATTLWSVSRPSQMRHHARKVGVIITVAVGCWLVRLYCKTPQPGLNRYVLGILQIDKKWTYWLMLKHTILELYLIFVTQRASINTWLFCIISISKLHSSNETSWRISRRQNIPARISCYQLPARHVVMDQHGVWFDRPVRLRSRIIANAALRPPMLRRQTHLSFVINGAGDLLDWRDDLDEVLTRAGVQSRTALSCDDSCSLIRKGLN